MSPNIDFDVVRSIGLALPGVEESTSYGTPALKVKGKFLTRLREEDGSIVIRVGSFEERDYLMRTDARTFFITDHYKDYPYVLIRLDKVKRTVLRDLITDAWRRVAPRKLVAAFDAANDANSSTHIISKGE